MRSVIAKSTQGYGYKYTELAQINKYCIEELGIVYYQYIEPVDGVDYIMTVLVDLESGEEHSPRRGCRVPDAKLSGKSNPAQEYGSALTYARRYSLMMALGIATTDDDAESLTVHDEQENKTYRKQLLQYCNDNMLYIQDVANTYGLSKKSSEEDYKKALEDLRRG